MSHHREIQSDAIDQVLSDAVASGAVPNVVAIAADADGTFYEGAAGNRIADKDSEPVSVDTHFRIMSMTKMVATTAALQQMEKGTLDLDAPSSSTARRSRTRRFSMGGTATPHGCVRPRPSRPSVS